VIDVTRLGGGALVINVDLILSIEPRPDTMIVFACGEKLLVLETRSTDRRGAHRLSPSDCPVRRATLRPARVPPEYRPCDTRRSADPRPCHSEGPEAAHRSARERRARRLCRRIRRLIRAHTNRRRMATAGMGERRAARSLRVRPRGEMGSRRPHSAGRRFDRRETPSCLQTQTHAARRFWWRCSR
jgi:hypothetical protein